MTDPVREALRELTERVMGQSGVVGTAVGERDGKPCLKVFVKDPSVVGRLPSRLCGYPVVAETTGPFQAR